MADLNLESNEILEWEFHYARETAAQAQNDRTTILNLYLLIVGAIGSAMLALPSRDVPRGAYALLFGLLGVVGLFTLLKLIRLRQAWHDSVLAMNQIKDFYLAHYPSLEKAFHWRTTSVPPLGKLWTITFDLALLVALVDSVAMGVAIHLSGWRLPLGDYALDLFAACVFFLWQAWIYFYQLPLDEK